MKKLICLLFVVAWFSSPPMGEAAEESESHHEKNILVDLSKIPRNQPIIKRIFEWNHRIVVETEDLYYRLDLEKQTATPISCPGDRSLIGLSGQSEDNIFALCKDDGGLFLIAKRGMDWGDLTLPDSLRRTTGRVFLLSNADRLVLVSDKHIYQYSKNRWKQIPYQQKKSSQSRQLFTLERTNHIVLFHNKLFIGHDWGEFGGGLVSLDLDTGKWEEQLRGQVTGLAINSKKELWASHGLMHMVGIGGTLWVFDGKLWNIFSKNNGFIDDSKVGMLLYKKGESKNWPFEPSDFRSLGFDVDDNLTVLSGALGILKYKNGNWVKWIEFPADPSKYIYVSSFYIVDNDTVLIGLYDGGIVKLNLLEGKQSRMKLTESFNHFDRKSNK